MQFPRGIAGKTLIAKVFHLIGFFKHSKNGSQWQYTMLQVFLPLLLQKPSPK